MKVSYEVVLADEVGIEFPVRVDTAISETDAIDQAKAEIWSKSRQYGWDLRTLITVSCVETTEEQPE